MVISFNESMILSSCTSKELEMEEVGTGGQESSPFRSN
jgi:hypothetical protein